MVDGCFDLWQRGGENGGREDRIFLSSPFFQSGPKARGTRESDRQRRHSIPSPITASSTAYRERGKVCCLEEVVNKERRTRPNRFRKFESLTRKGARE